MENGLPQNTVQAMVQTRDGFIWLGTEVGLVRFDGNSFQTFDRNSSPALPGNDVRCLLATSDGALWIGTSDGLARWKDGAVTAFTTKDGLPGNNVERILETSEGELWVNTDQGLARFTAEGFAHRGGLPEGPVEAISLDDGTLWVDTPNGSFVRRKGAWNIPSIAGLPPVGPKFHVRLQSGWAAASNKGVLIQEGSIPKDLDTGRELSGSKVQALYPDREGTLWIGTNGGLARWVAGKLEESPSPIRWPRLRCWR